MITSLRLLDFKAHEDTTVALEPLTILVGPNGSGKTALLDAIHHLSGTVVAEDEKTGVAETGLLDVLHRRPSFQESWGVVAQGRAFQADFTASVLWQTQARRGSRALDVAVKAEGGLPEGFYRSQIGNTALFRLNAQAIATPGSSKKPLPQVESDGANTAAVLKAIKLGHDAEWTRIVDVLRAVVPEVDSIGLEQVPEPSEYPPYIEPSGEWSQIFFNLRHANRIPARVVSEGTLLTLTLATILFGPSSPNIVMIDDIEQGLHPVGQRELTTQLKQLASLEVMQGKQIIATTHSPYILDGLDYENVRVFALDKRGASRVKSLADHPRASSARGSVSAGELWMSDPESKWVVET